MSVLTVKFPIELDNSSSLGEVSNKAKTVLATALAASGETQINVLDSTVLPASGAVSIDNEIIYYSSIVSGKLQIETRGAQGTIANTHLVGALVYLRFTKGHYEALRNAVINTQTKLGAGNSTPSADKFLKGNSDGTSSWSSLTNADINTAIGGIIFTSDAIRGTALGKYAMPLITTGNNNTTIGWAAGYPITTGYANTLVGANAGYTMSATGIQNTFLGYLAGGNATGNANVFLGYGAGSNETGSNKLYIANTNTTTPLLYGEFDNKILNINGSQTILSQSTTSVPLTLKAFAGQTANTVQISDSNNVLLSAFNNLGYLGIKTTSATHPLTVYGDTNTAKFLATANGGALATFDFPNAATKTAWFKFTTNNETYTYGQFVNEAYAVSLEAQFNIQLQPSNEGGVTVGYNLYNNIFPYKLGIMPSSVGQVGLRVIGFPSQSADLQQWADGGGTIISRLKASGAIEVPDEAYSVSWNGKTEVPTKNAIWDAFGDLGNNVSVSNILGNNHIGQVKPTPTGSNNTSFGYYSSAALTTGSGNTAIGSNTHQYISTASYNTAIGEISSQSLTTGQYNTSVGRASLSSSTIGNLNVGLGYGAGYRNISGGYNTFVGGSAGYDNLGNGNVFLGYSAGFSETGSNKLYIANSNTATPLIYGEFDNKILNINGSMTISSATFMLDSTVLKVKDVLQDYLNFRVQVEDVDYYTTTLSFGSLSSPIAPKITAFVDIQSNLNINSDGIFLNGATTIQGKYTGSRTLTLLAVAGQTLNILETRDSNNVTLSGIKTNGNFFTINDAYGSGWNGNLEVPTKDAIYDKIESLAVGGGSATKFTANVGDGSATVFVLTHNLGTRDVFVSIRRNAAPYDYLLVDAEATDINTVTVRFSSVPSANEFRVVII